MSYPLIGRTDVAARIDSCRRAKCLRAGIPTIRREEAAFCPVVALVLAVVAVVLVAWAAFRPAPPPTGGPEYTGAQGADAKSAVCTALNLVRKGVSVNTNLPAPGGEADATGTLAVAANARLSLSDGGQYLLNRLDPATPPELADSVRRLADALLDIGAAASAGAENTDPEQAARLRGADTTNGKVIELCK